MSLVLRLGPSLGFVTVRLWEDSFLLAVVERTDNISGSFVGGVSCCSRCIGWEDSGGGTTGVGESLISLALRSGRLLSSFMLRVSLDILRRKRRLRSVVRRLPSTKTRYYLYGRASTIVPVLFQSRGWCQCWFWIATGSPTLSEFKCLSWTCLLRLWNVSWQLSRTGPRAPAILDEVWQGLVSYYLGGTK